MMSKMGGEGREPGKLHAVPSPDLDQMTDALARFLRAAGLPEAAAGETPRRSATAWAEQLLSGYRQDPVGLLKNTWPDQTGDMVTLLGVPFVSVCEHHLLPFYGTTHLAYLPDGRLTGLSRLAALVRALSRRLQVQERLTEELADALMSGLAPRGAACVIEAAHDCVGARSLEHREARVQTFAYRGAFEEDSRLQDRFLSLVLRATRQDDDGGAQHAEERSDRA